MANESSMATMPTERPSLVSCVAFDGCDDATLLGFAASLAHGLEAPLATAILENAREHGIPIRHVAQFHAMTGTGVTGTVEGHSVVLGRSSLFAALGLSIDTVGDGPERLRRQGQSVLLVAVDGRTAGFLGIKEVEMRSSSFTGETFPTAIIGLPQAHSPEVIELADGDQFDLHLAPVTKRFGDATVRLLAYNGSIPGPTLRVRQGSQLLVDVVNDGDLETTVHWHGLRLENRYDGTTATQQPIPIGGTFTYRLTFPDPGVYWYHPHIREDYGQEMGLYGNIVVVPSEPNYWPPAHRELALMLDDIRIEDGRITPFNPFLPTFTAMGRFGNVLLVNGEPQLALRATRGEVVRYYLTNTANTRVFNVGLPGARLKVVGGDSGRYEHETFVEHVLIAPSERVVVDVLFDQPGELRLQHHTPDRTYPLATVTVGVEPAQPSLASQFEHLRTDADLAVERSGIANYVAAEPDKTLALVAEMNMGEPELPPGAAVVYTCPMHADVISNEPGRCPKCGMKLMATNAAVVGFACPMHPDIKDRQAGRCPKCGMKMVPAQLVGAVSHGEHQETGDEEYAHETAGIEWEDDMLEVNRLTNPTNMHWRLVDRQTGSEGASIDWRFRVGDRVKIRLINEMDSDHPMHHPFHIHGAGRFLIVSRDGIAEPNLVWKDTVLVRTGQTVDILFEATHPGVWMAHCHIAEHHESGMMLTFRVEP